MGVANDHSIAWGIASELRKHGAELAFTYQGEAFGKRVKPLADSVGSKILLPCDVEDIATVDNVFAELKKSWGKIDFLVHAIAFSDKNELKGKYADTTRDNFIRTMVISCFSFTEIARRAAALMPDGGSMVTLTYGGSVRVMPNYNVMGVAKAALEVIGAIFGRRLRPARHSRECDFGRPHAHPGRCRHRRCPRHVQLPEQPRAVAPHDHAGGSGRRRCLPALALVRRRDRRNPLRRFRLQHHLHAKAGRALVPLALTDCHSGVPPLPRRRPTGRREDGRGGYSLVNERWARLRRG